MPRGRNCGSAKTSSIALTGPHGTPASLSAAIQSVIASRGGTYAPGTPREPYEYVQNYLEAFLKDTLELDLDFFIPELTAAVSHPEMASWSRSPRPPRAKALEDAAAKAKALAERLAACPPPGVRPNRRAPGHRAPLRGCRLGPGIRPTPPPPAVRGQGP